MPNNYSIYWHVNAAGNDVVHNGELSYHTPAFTEPYPSVFWEVNQAGNDVVYLGELSYHTPAFTTPYPSVFWEVNQLGDDVVHAGELDYEKMGAFCHSTELSRISIPQTVKYIGEYAFRNTNLRSVTIASDCTYYNTSFPNGCAVNFYPD